MRKNDKVILILGCLLLLCGLGLFFVLQMKTKTAESKNVQIVQAMESILIDRKQGAKDFERESKMPALELYGEDFIALLEIPVYGLKLPIGSAWDKRNVVSHPCRFHGSVYDGTLIVGGYDQVGQFDFFDKIQNDTVVTITDMTGNVFSYVVTQVERFDSAQADILIDDTSDLTLFVRDAQVLEYILLRCTMKLH